MKRIISLFVALAVCASVFAEGSDKVLFGGEMHNSNSTTPESLESSFCLAHVLGFNAVLAAVPWDIVEPEEGVFDFGIVDNIIASAKKNNLLAGILWFGSYKNGESSYAPLWVKRDTRKYFRCADSEGEASTTISPFCTAAQKADAAAFSRLMAYIRDNDRGRRICVVQVENEVGAFMERDMCPAAMKAWKRSRWSKSPEMLAPQHFMAEAFAAYVDAVAQAGKKEYDIPMFANAWLKAADAPYGSYPNGGPRIAVLDTWKARVKHLDWLSPDIYDQGFAELCEPYSQGQPLFIPETRREIGRYYYAFGEKRAKGVFSFGFEESYDDPYYSVECRTFSEILPFLDAGLPSRGFFREPGVVAPGDSLNLQLGGYTFRIHYIEGEKNAHGIIIQTGKDEFVVAGVGAWIDFSSSPGEVCKIAVCEELTGGKVSQILNGDETGHHNMLYLRGRLHLDDYTAPDGVVNPAPDYGLSYQRRFWSSTYERFKTSGIYRIKLYSYPSR